MDPLFISAGETHDTWYGQGMDWLHPSADRPINTISSFPHLSLSRMPLNDITNMANQNLTTPRVRSVLQSPRSTPRSTGLRYNPNPAEPLTLLTPRPEDPPATPSQHPMMRDAFNPRLSHRSGEIVDFSNEVQLSSIQPVLRRQEAQNGIQVSSSSLNNDAKMLESELESFLTNASGSSGSSAESTDEDATIEYPLKKKQKVVSCEEFLCPVCCTQCPTVFTCCNAGHWQCGSCTSKLKYKCYINQGVNTTCSMNGYCGKTAVDVSRFVFHDNPISSGCICSDCGEYFDKPSDLRAHLLKKVKHPFHFHHIEKSEDGECELMEQTVDLYSDLAAENKSISQLCNPSYQANLQSGIHGHHSMMKRPFETVCGLLPRYYDDVFTIMDFATFSNHPGLMKRQLDLLWAESSVDQSSFGCSWGYEMIKGSGLDEEWAKNCLVMFNVKFDFTKTNGLGNSMDEMLSSIFIKPIVLYSNRDKLPVCTTMVLDCTLRLSCYDEDAKKKVCMWETKIKGVCRVSKDFTSYLAHPSLLLDVLDPRPLKSLDLCGPPLNVKDPKVNPNILLHMGCYDYAEFRKSEYGLPDFPSTEIVPPIGMRRLTSDAVMKENKTFWYTFNQFTWRKMQECVC